KSTYVDALPGFIHPQTGRIHTSFNQTGAATGLLSSSDPNLQNIPVRTPRGEAIRRAFVAPPGAMLLTADYSQIELRLLAHLSRDPAFVQAFEQGGDIHRQTAALHTVAQGPQLQHSRVWRADRHQLPPPGFGCGPDQDRDDPYCRRPEGAGARVPHDPASA